MHVLQSLPLTDLVLVPSCNGLGTVNPLLEKKQLGAGRGQLRLRCAKGGCGGVRTPRHFGQFGPEGRGPTLSFGPDQLQPRFVLALEIRASFRHAAVDLFLGSGFARGNVILCLSHQALPRIQPLKVRVALGASSVSASSRF